MASKDIHWPSPSILGRIPWEEEKVLHHAAVEASRRSQEKFWDDMAKREAEMDSAEREASFSLEDDNLEVEIGRSQDIIAWLEAELEAARKQLENLEAQRSLRRRPR